MLTATAAVLSDGRVMLEQVDLPPRTPGEIDIAIDAAAVCGSDLHTFLGHRPAPPRTALGHEGVGRILEVDPGTVDFRGTPLSPGARVVFAIFSSCGTCDRCRADLPMKCTKLFKLGHESVTRPPHASGTIATHIRLPPGVAAIAIPDELTDARAVSASCAVATAAAMIRVAGSPEEALVFGAGAVGTYAAAMLASRGTRVSIVDPSDGRRRQAARLGAGSYSGSRDDFPVVVEASGHPSAFRAAIDAADVGGVVVAAGSVSPGHGTATLDPARIVTRLLTVVGVHNYTPNDLDVAVGWLETHAERLRLDQLVSPPVPLSKVDEAFEVMARGDHLRAMVVPDQTS